MRIVHWILAQLVEAVHSQRTDTLRERIGEFTSLVPMEGFITLRECRRKGFSEAESRQICLLEPRLLELYEHAPPSGEARGLVRRERLCSALNRFTGFRGTDFPPHTYSGARVGPVLAV